MRLEGTKSKQTQVRTEFRQHLLHHIHIVKLAVEQRFHLRQEAALGRSPGAKAHIRRPQTRLHLELLVSDDSQSLPRISIESIVTVEVLAHIGATSFWPRIHGGSERLSSRQQTLVLGDDFLKNDN
jgi:hypothetical protein